MLENGDGGDGERDLKMAEEGSGIEREREKGRKQGDGMERKKVGEEWKGEVEKRRQNAKEG